MAALNVPAGLAPYYRRYDLPWAPSEETERRFRWLFEESPVAIALVDPDGSISSANETLLSMVGGQEEEITGLAVTDLILQDDRAAVAEQMSRVLLGASLGARLPVRLRGDGRERRVLHGELAGREEIMRFEVIFHHLQRRITALHPVFQRVGLQIAPAPNQ